MLVAGDATTPTVPNSESPTWQLLYTERLRPAGSFQSVNQTSLPSSLLSRTMVNFTAVDYLHCNTGSNFNQRIGQSKENPQVRRRQAFAEPK